MDKVIEIRNLDPLELDAFGQAMSVLPWYRDNSLTHKYLTEQRLGTREFLIATMNNQYAGHVSLIWHSAYPYFREQNIPELSDLLVLPIFQRNGIGRMLVQHCEALCSIKTGKIGLAVGLYKDYAPAARLYLNMGYQLDCQGATSHYRPVSPGSSVTVDDDLVIWLLKDLKS